MVFHNIIEFLQLKASCFRRRGRNR